MDNPANLSIEDGIGVIRIDSPPVNALSVSVRRALDASLRAFAEDDSVTAIVLMCGGRTFFAGADIAEFGRPRQHPQLSEIFDQIENSPKPVVAAIHGSALGGGYELALACHYRIAVPSATVGLPEVKLGLLPGAGGTQRLPRLIGPEAALDVIVGGDPVAAPRAAALGMIDAVAGEGRLCEDATAFARRKVAEDAVHPRIRDNQTQIDPARFQPALFDRFRSANPRLMRGFKAPAAIVDAIELAVRLPFEEGLVRERELFASLETSTESAAQRHLFFAERQTARIPDIPRDTPTIPIDTIGVVGAGTMGGGIAMAFIDAGLPVTVVERTQEALDRGLTVIRRNYERMAARGGMTEEECERRMALITPAKDMEALAGSDLIIEAVFEEMGVKKNLFAGIDAIAKPSAVLASNTSYLDLDEIAAATARPESVIGLHFFSPANVMRLLEIVRGARTSPNIVATAFALAKKIGKVPVLSRVGPGFIANRIMATRKAQANQLVLEGTSPQQIDQAIQGYGFALGPFRMLDMVGLDVIGRDSADRTLAGDLVAICRLGQKSGGGFYDYDEARRASPSPIAAEAIADHARFRSIARKPALSAEEIVARLLYPVVNEGARALEEGISLRASDIDVAAVLGYNWPAFTGGPMFWADTIGLKPIVETLKAFESTSGPAFAPSALLEEMAKQGTSFHAR